MSETPKDPRQKRRGQLSLRQGDIFTVEVGLLRPISSCVSEHASASQTVIVLSHDCDIDASEEKEPYIEVISLLLPDKTDSRMTHGKNARCLYLTAFSAKDGGPQHVRLDASSRFTVMKSDLWDRSFLRPFVLQADGRAELADWLSARYRRAALPNEFVKRFDKVADSFWSAVADFNHEVSAVLLSFDEGQEGRDLPAEEPYTISVFLVCPAQVSASVDHLVDRLRELFESTYSGGGDSGQASIEVRGCVGISEDAISLAQYRRTIQLGSEHLSYESDPPGPTLAV